jgi:hypothetical protein
LLEVVLVDQVEVAVVLEVIENLQAQLQVVTQ